MTLSTEKPGKDCHYRVRLPLWVDFGVLLLIFAGLAFWSWRKWPDVFIDFGMDLYVPWQLSQGSRLYRDISWMNGPLSQYFNALLFQLGGVSITTLIAANLAIAALLASLIHRIFAFLFDRLTALGVCSVFLSVFAFAQYTRMGGFNYIAPYRHEQTHGLTLSVGMVYCLIRFLQQKQARWASLAGICLGLAALTKIELTVAAAMTALCAFVLIGVSGIASKREVLRHFGIFGAAALVPPVISILVLSTWLPLGSAFQNTFANFFITYRVPVLDEGLYLYVTGLDAPAAHLSRMVVLSGAFLLIVGLAIALQIWVAKRQLARSGLISIFLGLVTFLGAVAPQTIPWQEIGLILPVTTGLMIFMTVRGMQRAPQGSAAKLRLAGLFIWGVFAFGMMAKMLLNVRLYHYGFILAMPAALLLTAACLTFLPSQAARWAGSGSVVQAIMIALVSAGCLVHLDWSNQFYREKTLAVGRGGDAIMTYPYPIEPIGELMQRTVNEINRTMPTGATVLAMPQGITLNYLTRRSNGTPYSSFLPFDVKTYGGERRTLETIQAHPPDFVVLMHNGVRGFNGGFFGDGRESGKMLLDWLSRSYFQTWQIGALPFINEQPGVLILKRIPNQGR